MVGSIYDFFTLPGQVREANIRISLYNGMYSGQNGGNPQENWRYVHDGEAHLVHESEIMDGDEPQEDF
jgi:hypothetical protein